MPDRIVAPPGAQANCMCADCQATLYWARPAEAGFFHSLTQSVWTRALLLLLAAGMGFVINVWAGLLLLLVAGLTWVISPPGYRPRCPRCGSLDIRHIGHGPTPAATDTDKPVDDQ